MDETERLVHACLAGEADPWDALCAAAGTLPDPVDLWPDALTLQALGHRDEALACVRSALQDMYWHPPCLQLEAARLAEA